jgi:hypothetical protein
MQLILGEVIKHENKPWRVVRIIEKSRTLFEPEQGEGAPFILEESYVELKGPEGDINFIVLAEEKQPYTGPSCPILGLSPVTKQKGVSSA